MLFSLCIAVGTITLLGYAGVRNRRFGYVRKREDTLLGILMASAQARDLLSGEGDRRNTPAKQVTPVEQSLSAALISLHQALGESSGVEPTPDRIESSPAGATLRRQ